VDGLIIAFVALPPLAGDVADAKLRSPITPLGLLVDSPAREAAGAPVPSRMRERIGKLGVETGNIAHMVAEAIRFSPSCSHVAPIVPTGAANA
jgi:hypothetical protein